MTIGELEEGQRYCMKVQYFLYNVPAGLESCTQCEFIPVSSKTMLQFFWIAKMHFLNLPFLCSKQYTQTLKSKLHSQNLWLEKSNNWFKATSLPKTKQCPQIIDKDSQYVNTIQQSVHTTWINAVKIKNNYSEGNKYLIPCRFCKFAHWQRNERSIMLMVGLF